MRYITAISLVAILVLLPAMAQESENHKQKEHVQNQAGRPDNDGAAGSASHKLKQDSVGESAVSGTLTSPSNRVRSGFRGILAPTGVGGCPDLDGDTYQDAACNPDPLNGGGDCDDNSAAINPGALETCDGQDNDCDAGTLDGSEEAWFGAACDGLDEDLCDEGTLQCDAGVQTCTDNSGDTLEICDNEIDDDCDGSVDEADCVGGQQGLRFRSGTKAWLDWDADSSAVSYALYAGSIAAERSFAYNHRCEFSELPTPEARVDTIPLLPGDAAYYLAASANDPAGLGDITIASLGTTSAGAERPDARGIDCGVQVYVDPDALLEPDGLSWATAFTTISSALEHPRTPSRSLEIWVHGAVEDPDVVFDSSNPHPGVRILGGFAGTEERAWERDTASNSTTWEGAAGLPLLTVRDRSFAIDGLALRVGSRAIDSENATLGELRNTSAASFDSNVVDVVTRANAMLIVDQFSVIGSASNGLSASSRGGVLSGRITRSTFEGNGGAGLVLGTHTLEGFDAEIYVDVIANRIADNNEGLLLRSFADNSDGGSRARALIASNWVSGNTTNGVRLAAFLDHQNPAAAGCALVSEINAVLTGNTVADNGESGLVNELSRSVDLFGCADGAQLVTRTKPDIWNNLLTGNAAYAIEERGDDSTAGLEGDPLSLVSNDLWFNGNYYRDEGSTTLFTIGAVNGLSGARLNFDLDPLYVNSGADDYHLGTGSPARDRGEAGSPRGTSIDADSESRVVDGDGDGDSRVDVGADEAR